MKLCMRFSWQGLGEYASMSGTAKIITAPPLPVAEALDQFALEMRREYPRFNYRITETPVVARALLVPPLWRRLLAKLRPRRVNFGYLDTGSRDVIIVEVQAR